MKRLFLAVDLSIGVVERLVMLQEAVAARLREHPDVEAVRWVDAPLIHVTLKFLGEAPETMLPELTDRLEALVRPLFPFEVHCRGFGASPDPSRARLLHAGLDDNGAEVMGLLCQAIERDLDAVGFRAEPRPYHPQITLGRLRASRPVDLRPITDEFADLHIGSSYVRDIVLFESELTRKGPIYRVLDRFPLGEH